MTIELLYNTPLWVAAKAIRKCWASEDKSDTIIHSDEAYTKDIDGQMFRCEAGPKDKALIERVGNKNKHASTLEHLNYTFDIDGISRACLQEVARHRHASLSVKSTRYTLKELKEGIGSLDDYVVLSGNDIIDDANWKQINELQEALQEGVSNDIAKYMLPEAYKTSLVWTINMRSLQNFLSLRTDKAALWEIRELAYELFNQLPEEHKYMFTDYIKEK
jgi:thymidylate synthase (FAD)